MQQTIQTNIGNITAYASRLPTPIFEQHVRYGNTIINTKYFLSEQRAEEYGKFINASKRTWGRNNHPCGRDEDFDFTHEIFGYLYAVTVEELHQ